MNFKTIILVVFTLLETLLFGGLLTGWSSQVYVLKEEGLFENLCGHPSNNSNLEADPTPETSTNITNTTTEDIAENSVKINSLCPEQDAQLNLFFSVVLAISNVCIVFIGIADNHIGTKITRLIFMMLFAAGSLLLAFTTKESPWLLLPGLFLIGIGGFSLLVTNIHISFILSRGSAVYIGILSGCFDSSAAVQWVVKVLYEAGVSTRYSFITIAILNVVNVGVTTILHPVTKDNNKASDVSEKTNEIQQENVDTKHLPPTSEFDTDRNVVNVGVSTKLHPVTKDNNKARDVSEETNQIKQENGDTEHPPPTNESDTDRKTDVQRQECAYPKETEADGIQEVPQKEDVSSKSISVPMYVLHIGWFTINSLKFFYFIGSINYRLEITLNDREKVGYFTDVLAYITFGGIFMSFIAGSISEWQKRLFIDKSETKKRLMPQILPLCLCSMLTIIISILEFSTNPNLLYVMFVLVVMLRGFVFAINMDFIASVFPEVYVTFLLGLNSTIGGALSLIQFALFAWNKSHLQAPLYVSGFFLALGVISLIHPVNIYRTAKLVKN